MVQPLCAVPDDKIPAPNAYLRHILIPASFRLLGLAHFCASGERIPHELGGLSSPFKIKTIFSHMEQRKNDADLRLEKPALGRVLVFFILEADSRIFSGILTHCGSFVALLQEQSGIL